MGVCAVAVGTHDHVSMGLVGRACPTPRVPLIPVPPLPAITPHLVLYSVFRLVACLCSWPLEFSIRTKWAIPMLVTLPLLPHLAQCNNQRLLHSHLHGHLHAYPFLSEVSHLLPQT
jgi:hypothetical protein